MSEQQVPTLGFYQQTQTSTLSRFFIDEEIQEPSYYRNLIQTLLSSQEGDVVEIWINSVGGRMDSAQSIIGAMENSEADVVCVLQGQVISAASMIALRAPKVIVMPSSTMMIHEATYGIYGKHSDNCQQFDFSKKILDNEMNLAYKYFLSKKELKQVKNGKEIWLTSEEILERLERRQKKMIESSNQKETAKEPEEV